MLGDWIVENITGKPDTAAIYDGMETRENKNPRKRKRFFAKTRLEFSERLKIAKDNILITSDADVASDLYVYSFLDSIFDQLPEHIRMYNAIIEDRIIDRALKVVPISDTMDEDKWKQALEKLGGFRVAVELIPSVFDHRLRQRWEEVRKSHREEQQKRHDALMRAEAQRREKEEADKRAIEKIFLLRDEIRRLNEIYYNANDRMLKYKLIISIETTQHAIRRLKDTLSVPIEDDPIEKIR